MRCRFILACRMVSILAFAVTNQSRSMLTERTGFAVVGEYDDDHIKLAQTTAYEQMLKWLKEH